MSKKWYIRFNEMLEDSSNPYFHIANRFLGLLTLVAVLAVVLDTVPNFRPYQAWINAVEWTAVLIFSFEYLVRFLSADSKIKYAFSFYGIVDLMAIAPTYVGLGNFSFLKSARSVRTIRLLRVARLMKLSRFEDQKEGKHAVLGLSIEIYILALFMLTTLLGSLFYLFETETPEASTIPLGMLWVLKIIIGGIPTPQPETFGGIVTLTLTRFSAVMIFGFVIGIVGNFLRLKLTGTESDL